MELFTLEGEADLLTHLTYCNFTQTHRIVSDDVFVFVMLLFYVYSPCQVCLAFGTLILFAGLIVVLVGYATPAKIETFGEDDLLFVDRYRNDAE